MAYHEHLARRIQGAFKLFPKEISNEIIEKKMFGGCTFLYKNKMNVGIIKEDLAVRVIADKLEKLLKNKYVRPMDFAKNQ